MRHLLFLVLVSFAACEPSGGKPDASGDMTPLLAPFALATTLNTDSPQATSELFTTPSLTSGTANESQAITIADTVTVSGMEGSGSFYVTGSMTPTVTRYDVDATGTITPGTVLSFANFGLGSTYSTRAVVLVSPTKAYLLDDSSLQAITFDPSAMVVGSAVDLSAMKMAGYVVNFAYNIPVRGTQIVVTGYYYDSGYSKALPQTALALIDTSADTATFVSDTRCGVFSTVATTTNGDLYFGSDTYAVSLDLISSTAAPPGCLLRMKAGENVLDPDYFVSITTLTGGKPGGAAVPASDGGFWIRVFDEALFPITPATSAIDVLDASAWSWWKVDPSVGNGTATKSAFAPSAGEVKPFTAGGATYVGDSSDGYLTSTLLDMTSGADVIKGETMRGFPAGSVKVH